MHRKKDLKSLLNFEYGLNHKVEGFIDKDEAHELIYEGYISKLFEPTYPKTIGIFDLYIFDLEKSRDFNLIDKTLEAIKDYSDEIMGKFANFYKFIEDDNIDFMEKDRVIFLSNCILLPEYRGKDVITELIKSIYLTHFTKNSLFIINATPLQNMSDELDMHLTEVPIDATDGNGESVHTISGEYFNLKNLPSPDEEYDFKFFAKMLKLNFKKFGETNYFYQDSKKEIEKIFK